MPLEISEIGVRISLPDAQPGASVAIGAQPPAAPSPAQLRELVTQCVRDVLATLRMLEAR